MFFFCFYNWGSVIKRVPIIGKDFLSHYELLVDCKNNRLIDATTSLAIQGHTAPPFIHSVKTVAAEVQLDPLLREFPELTTPAWINRKIHHNAVHHMKTTPGPPVACRPRRLDPRRLSIAKAEFSAMLQDGTARRANGPWSSALSGTEEGRRMATLRGLPCPEFQDDPRQVPGAANTRLLTPPNGLQYFLQNWPCKGVPANPGPPGWHPENSYYHSVQALWVPVFVLRITECSTHSSVSRMRFSRTFIFVFSSLDDILFLVRLLKNTSNTYVRCSRDYNFMAY